LELIRSCRALFSLSYRATGLYGSPTILVPPFLQMLNGAMTFEHPLPFFPRTQSEQTERIQEQISFSLFAFPSGDLRKASWNFFKLVHGGRPFWQILA